MSVIEILLLCILLPLSIVGAATVTFAVTLFVSRHR